MQNQLPYRLRENIYENSDRSISIYKTRKKQTLRSISVKVYNKRRHPNYSHEYDLLKDINHPNIVRVLGCTEDSEHFYMEMEFCASGDLSHCLWPNKNSNYFEKVIKSVSTELLLGLRTLHMNGIIHCNLKPSNILIDEFGKVKICDFKKSLLVNTMTLNDIKKNKTAMTPCYTAPELFQDKGAYSFKTDLWALGCIMYEMAAGQVPFFDEGVSRLIHKIINEDVNYNRKQFTVYSDEFLNVVKRLLEKNPNNRPGWGEIEKMPFWDLSQSELNDDANNTSSSNSSTNTIKKDHSNSGTLMTNNNNEFSDSTAQGAKTASNTHTKSFSSGVKTKNSISSSNNQNNQNNNDIQVVGNEEEDDDYSNNKVDDVGNADQEFNFKNQSNQTSNANSNINSEESYTTGKYQSNQSQPQNQQQNKKGNELEFSVLNISKIITKDKRIAKNQNLNEMTMSFAKPDDLPQIQTIMIHNSDKVVKPIIGNKIIEPHPQIITYDPKKIPLKTLLKIDKIKEMIYNENIEELEAYLLSIYQLMEQSASRNNFDLLWNLLSYFETIILAKEVANNIINTSFVKLFINFMDIDNDNIRIRACSCIAYLIRYATSIEQSLDKFNMCEKLISFISDDNLDLNRKAIATLGEYLFFVSTQAEGASNEGLNIENNYENNWGISQESLTALLYALNHSDEIVKFYSLKTIENISILTTIAKNYFASSDDYLLKIINIYNEINDNSDIKTSALSTISHLIKQEPKLLKVFIDKMDNLNELIDKETPKNQQCLINCLLFGIVNDINNKLIINLDLLLPSFINLLETANSIIKSKIILILSYTFGDNLIIIKYGEKIFNTMQKLRKEKQQFYCYVKIFESFMVNFCENLYKYFITLARNYNNSQKEIIIFLKAIVIICPYYKISYSLFKSEFLESIINVIQQSNSDDVYTYSFDILKFFSENSYSVEENSDYIIKNLFINVLNLTNKINPMYQRFPLNICANILTVLLEDDKLYSSVSIEGGKTNQINSLIITILPIVSDLVKNPDTANDSLSFLSLILERNSAFISFYKSVGIINYIFELMKDSNYYSNLNLIKILVKLIESNDTDFKDINEMDLIDKVNYLINKDNYDDISIYTEYVMEMLFDLMYKINEVKKRNSNNNNFDKDSYRKNFLPKIGKLALNFKLCIKLLGCDNPNIQEKACISLIFMLQFFPEGYVENVNVYVKFTSEDIPDLLKGLDSNCTKIHKKIIKIFKWIIEYQNDSQSVLNNYLSYIQIYVEKIRDSSKEPDVVDVAMKFLNNDLKKLFNNKTNN